MLKKTIKIYWYPLPDSTMNCRSARKNACKGFQSPQENIV
nr:unnamed protein product [Callosobruchus analis]